MQCNTRTSGVYTNAVLVDDNKPCVCRYNIAGFENLRHSGWVWFGWSL